MTAFDDLGAQLGNRYRIERELGRGGMGAVYLARDVRLDRPVALKVLPPDFAKLPALRDRFLRETRTAASFSHPNIVPVYAVEDTEQLLAYAMAYVEGESLGERVNRTGPITIRETVRLLQDVGYALAYAHGRGIVHRDIKPDNIMIERATGRALVMDFGIARLIAARPAAVEGLTRVGEVVGTPEYMSPEQATGDEVDGRSDVYSLGLTAHFALTGQPAVTGDTTGKVLARQITEPLPPMKTKRPDLPAALAAAIDRCVQKDPNERFANAESLVEALDAAQLAAPEIPLSIRLFAHEVGMLSVVLVGGALLIVFMLQALNADSDSVDMMLPIVVLVSVLFTRVLQTLREAGRLEASGFTDADVERGFLAVVDERETRRTELRADPRTRLARRRTLIAAVAQLVGAVVAFRLGLNFRHQVGPHMYQVELPGMIFVFTSMILFGVSVALLLRSPFRMPIGERLFRLVWLGPIGRAFFRLAGRGARRTPAAAPVGARTTGPRVAERVTAAARAGPTDAVASLESRVEQLERWRAETERGVAAKPTA